jgi:HD superfamily phosphohydrolase
MCLHNDKVVLRKGGITAAEGLMVSRSLMYSTVYYHKTVKVIEAMLRRAVEISGIDLSELYLMTDADLISALLGSGGKSADLMRSVMNRRLYKKCLTVYSIDAGEDFKASLVKFSNPEGRRQLEEEIASAAGTDPRDVIVDIPSESTLLSKIKIGETDVSILDSEDRVRSITKYSTVAKALQSRGAIDWSVMVSAPAKDYENVRRAASRVLAFDDADRP